MRHQIARLAPVALLFAVALSTGGCLVKETSATLCLEPDGGVRWTVLERNVHATGDTPADRQREEEAFMAAVAINQHPKAVAFRDLGGSDVRSEVVSSAWPFAVATEARFPDVARVCQQILDRIGEVHGQSRLDRRDGRTTWTVTLDYVEDTEPSSAGSDDDGGVSLLGDDPPAFFLRHGQFVEASGFDIADDGRAAKMKDLSDHDWSRQPHLVLSLTWTGTEQKTDGRKH